MANLVSRRKALVGLAAALPLSSGVAKAAADVRVTGDGSMIAEVAPEKLARVRDLQDCQNWCWAATFEMLFKSYDYDLPQQDIVLAAYGDLACRTAQVSMIIELANRVWTDRGGRAFASSIVTSYNAEYGVSSLDNDQIISELKQGRPLLYCNRSHMMLLTAIEYVMVRSTIQVTKMGVLDPWPGPSEKGFPGPVVGTRGLSISEMSAAHEGGEMTYIGRVKITDLAQRSSSPAADPKADMVFDPNVPGFLRPRRPDD